MDRLLERKVMSHNLHGESTAAFAERRWYPSRTFFSSVIDIMRTWIRRRQQRQELLDYMAIDHRAAADIGATGNEAREWAERPFWRA